MSEYYDLGKLKFVVVDDSDHWRSILRILLSALEIKDIHMFSDAEDALKELNTAPVDIVICDWEMPGMSGIDMVRRLRDEEKSPNPFIPVIVLSSHTQKHRVEEARDSGATEVLTKPVSAQALYEHIIGIIDKPRRFVRTDAFFGPERRRHQDDAYFGPERRKVVDADGPDPEENGKAGDGEALPDVGDILTKVRENRQT